MQETIAKASEVTKQWRQIPAPKKGELVRLIGKELRRNKDHLGSQYLLRWVNLSKRVMVKFKK